MTIQFDDYNEAHHDVDFIIKKTDVFTQSLIVESVGYSLDTDSDSFYGMEKFPPNGSFKWMKLPLKSSRFCDGIQYKSNPSGEEFSLICKNESISSIIININSNTNIVLKAEGAFEHYLISKKDFIKCCDAQSLSMRGCLCDKIKFEESCDDFILYFQAIYNEVIDNTKYKDATMILKDKYLKDLEAFKNWCEDKKKEQKIKNKRSIWKW